MLELWNNWYDTLASVEALATVVVIVLVAAGLLRWRKVGGDKRVRQKIDLGKTSANRSCGPA
jgi:amino acid transporter